MSITPELDAKFRAAAVREGLVDVATTSSTRRSATLLVAATERGLCRIRSTRRPGRTSLHAFRRRASSLARVDEVRA